jgi:hypothetical protein
MFIALFSECCNSYVSFNNRKPSLLERVSGLCLYGYNSRTCTTRGHQQTKVIPVIQSILQSRPLLKIHSCVTYMFSGIVLLNSPTYWTCGRVAIDGTCRLFDGHVTNFRVQRQLVANIKRQISIINEAFIIRCY